MKLIYFIRKYNIYATRDGYTEGLRGDREEKARTETVLPQKARNK